MDKPNPYYRKIRTAPRVTRIFIGAGLVIGGPLYVEQVVPERLRSTGQGVLAMVGFGAGGIASNAGSGWLIDQVGAWAPYTVGGLGAIALGLAVPLLLPAPRRPE